MEMSLHKLSLFVWAFLSQQSYCYYLYQYSCAITMLLTDRKLITSFYDQLEVEILFYINIYSVFFLDILKLFLIIPAFGIVSQVTSTFSGKPIFGYLGMVAQQET